jgi:hypothetical protein
MKQQTAALLLFLLDQFEQRMAQAEFGQSATQPTSSCCGQVAAAKS